METIKGYVEHIIFRNQENGYTVLNFICEEEEKTVVGMFQTIEPGETLELQGDYIEHPVYGAQFKIETYATRLPSDAEGIKRYLGSGAIKGIGTVLSERIVKKFGEDTFYILENEPERLAEVTGISERKAREIGVLAEEKKDIKEALMFLQNYGISNTIALKIYDTYQDGIYKIMKENPYQLSEDVKGVGFKLADEIARKAGIQTDSVYRVDSGILYTLLQAAGEGHMYLPLDMLLEKGYSLLEVSKELLEQEVRNLAMDKKVIIKGGNVYASSAYYAELNCAAMLYDLNAAYDKAEGILPSEEEAIYKKISMLEQGEGIQLDSLQRKAIFDSITSGVFLLTGGPGTGKTTTINTIIRYFDQVGDDFFLAAPTGRAAKRMTETTGYEAKTIHRLLELNGNMSDEEGRTYFERNEENPLEADVVIIDEMSMVDVYLFQALLRAITVGTRLILVGDMNQLPSVGPGKIIKDLVESDVFPVVRLEKIFRQDEESHIIVNAHLIYQGKPILLDNKSKDFFFLKRNDVGVIYKHMVQLITEKLPPYVEASPMEIQVLTPMRKGPLGVESLNKILQEYLNPPDQKKKEHTYGETVFREGDKIMQIKNNYKIEWEVVSRYNIPIEKGMGVFNGDMGIVKSINEFASEILVEFDEHRLVTYPFSALDELEPAYAITIHKSQGSEYPAVIIPLLSGPRMLFNRNLLYTGITRARKCVTILGNEETIIDMIKNENEQKRYAGLKERITEIFEKDRAMGLDLS